MNPSVSGHYPLLRHDPVTARAISRLSHGVARLTASLNPESQYRHFRARHAKSRNRIVSESLSTDSQCITAGSKRKWQPDKIELDTIMELEHPTINLKQTASPCVNLPHSSTEFLHHVSVSIDALNLQTKLLTPFSCSNPVLHKSMSSDNIETVGRYSSGSSMLSVTASSDNNCESDASSHDADVEDEDHNDLTYLKGGRSSLSRISKRKTLFDKQFYEIWKPFDDNVCNGGGDSSDGLSINIKIPRLSSMHLHGTSTGISDYSSTLSPISSHHSTKRCVHNMLASSSSDTNRPRKDKCKCKLRNIKNDSVHNNHKNGDHNCHKGCVKSGSRSSSSSSTISTEESSDQTYSKGFNMHKHRYTSIPECHKNYDGDKKVTACDNTKFPKKCSKSSVNTANDNNSSKQSVLPQAKLQYRPVDPYNSTLDEPVDPELDNLLHGTWPLLSGRAKLGYAKAMNASNSKRYPNSQKKNPPNLKNKEDSKVTNNRSIQFVPSKLEHVYTQDEGKKDSYGKSDKPYHQMPTPPWMNSDNESLRDSDEFDSDLNRKVTKSTVNNNNNNNNNSNQRPCIDNWKPELSNAAPLTETNRGHRLLQRLGWKPGDGLGKNNKGLITPVNCNDIVPSKCI